MSIVNAEKFIYVCTKTLLSSSLTRPVLKLQTGCKSDFIIFIDMSQRMKTSQYIYFVIQDSYFEQDFTFFIDKDQKFVIISV